MHEMQKGDKEIAINTGSIGLKGCVAEKPRPSILYDRLKILLITFAKIVTFLSVATSLIYAVLNLCTVNQINLLLRWPA